MANAPVTGPAPPQFVSIQNNPLVTSRFDPLKDPGSYRVNVPSQMEFLQQPLYSYQLYPAAGAVTLSFFQTPAGGTVTRQDTNMELGAQLPAPQMFLIQGIGVDWLPGTTAGLPVLGPRADSNTGALNDMFTIFRQGVLTLTIGSKQYLQQSPLMSMPPRSHFDGVAAVATDLTAGAATQTIMQIPYVTGDIFRPVPLLLEASQNFRVDINFPSGAVAVPSTDALARIGVVLYGTLYRPAQ